MLQGYGVTHVSWCRRSCGGPWSRWNGGPRSHASRSTPRSRPPTWPTATRGPAGRPGICMAQVVGALNLAAGLRDAHLANAPVIAMTGGQRPAHQVPQGLSGPGRRAGIRAGDQVQRDRGRGDAHSRPAAPRPSGLPCRASPARCICSSGATRGRSTTRKRRWEALAEELFARVAALQARARTGNTPAPRSMRSRRRSGRCSSPAAGFAHRVLRRSW